MSHAANLGRMEIVQSCAELGARDTQHAFDRAVLPMMAFHRGDISRLEKHLSRDPQLLERRFTLREIYPVECGCSDVGGMHWTPIDGATMLHLAVDFREREIFDWLLAHGADVNVRSGVDEAGFGGHTPLSNAVVSGPWPDAQIALTLLERGADRSVRASLRKFLDWIEDPHWYQAHNVTAAEWGHTFPEKHWVNRKALQVLDEPGS